MDFSLTDEQQRLVETARKFTREKIIPVAQKLDEHGTFPKEICEQAWEIGLMNVEFPQEVGGLGLSTLDHVLMAEEVNYGCAGIRTTVRKVGDEYVVTGQKRWITNARYAQWYTVFGRIGEPRERHKGITCFVVPRDAPGISVGRKEDKLGQRASDTSDVILEEVKLTKATLVGGEGQGFKIAMKTFDRSRPWIAAGACGIMRRGLDESRRYALERKAFGQPIAQFQAVQFMLAEMAMKYEATRLLMLKASWNIGQGKLD